jgi:capsular polysaccharide export protein
MHFDFVIPVMYTDDDVDYYHDLVGLLGQHGARAAFIAHTQRGHDRLREKGHEHVYYLYEGFDARKTPTVEEMTELEQRYQLGSMTDHVFPEEMMSGAQKRPLLLKRAVHTFRFLERFFAEHTASMFINNVGPELIRRSMVRLFEMGVTTNLVVDFAPIRGRVALTTSEVLWDDMPKTLPELGPKDREAMEAFLTHVTTERKMFTGPSPLGLKPKNFVNAARYAAQALQERFDPALGSLVRERGERVVRRVVNQRFYQKPRAENYVFFPLHLADDSAITIRAPQFQRQENLVAYVAERALPIGTKLYVKPHLGAMESYSIEMIRKIAKIPGVRVIDPRTNSHELIRGAQAMLVVNSTVGFESLFYQKPVVVLGRVFYRGYGVTTDVENLGDLRLAMMKAMSTPVDREKVLRFFLACHQATYPGILYRRTPENLADLSAAILDKMKRLGHTVGRKRAAPMGAATGA